MSIVHVQVLPIARGGLNERFSGTNAGTAFGNGVYLAEDLGKSDQYVELDERLSVSSELHQRPEAVSLTILRAASCGMQMFRKYSDPSTRRFANTCPAELPVPPLAFVAEQSGAVSVP